MKKSIIPLIAGLLLWVGIITFRYHNRQLNIEQPQLVDQKEHMIAQEVIDTKTWQAIAHDPTALILKTDPQQWLEQEEQEIWQQFAQLGISPKSYHHYEDVFREEYKRRFRRSPIISKRLRTDTVDIFLHVMKDFGINPATISLCTIDTATPLETTDYCIRINPQLFEQMSYHSKLFAAAHEIQHIVFKDNSTWFIINNLLNHNTRYDQRCQDTTQRFFRFCEARADYFAASKHPDYARGLVEYMTASHALRGENRLSTHPLKKTRLALGKKILHLHSFA